MCPTNLKQNWPHSPRPISLNTPPPPPLSSRCEMPLLLIHRVCFFSFNIKPPLVGINLCRRRAVAFSVHLTFIAHCLLENISSSSSSCSCYCSCSCSCSCSCCSSPPPNHRFTGHTVLDPPYGAVPNKTLFLSTSHRSHRGACT